MPRKPRAAVPQPAAEPPTVECAANPEEPAKQAILPTPAPDPSPDGHPGAVLTDVDSGRRGREDTQPKPVIDPLAVLAGRDWNAKRADPWEFHSVTFEDGYSIRVQESHSRGTVEVQFGDGSANDKPKNFEKIKELFRAHGLRWNGTNAWVKELVPVVGSFRQREDAKLENKELRRELEEDVLPAVVGLEEQLRGEIRLTADYRQRITQALTGNGIV